MSPTGVLTRDRAASEFNDFVPEPMRSKARIDLLQLVFQAIPGSGAG